MSQSPLAAIDVGSNTVKLTVAARDAADEVVPLYDVAVATRLGEHMAGRRLREAAMRRTLEEIRRLLQVCRRHDVRRVLAVGTSALRDAENCAEFVARAARLGVQVTPISGEDEARLTFASVRRDPLWRSTARLCVIDIGGGSTELISGARRPESCVSLPLGAVRLTESFLRSDPPTVGQITDASLTVADVLASISAPGQGCDLVGVGGTFVSMAAVKLGLAPHRAERLHGIELHAEDADRQLKLYGERTTAQRRQIAGLEPARADVILAGAIILCQALCRLGRDRIRVSTRGLRWGLLYEALGGPAG